MNYQSVFESVKEQSLFGRYITNQHIEPLLESLKKHFEISVIGESVQQKPIYQVKIGSGKTKIYIWSQMHGNESTCTKALFDLFNYLKSDAESAKEIRERFTLLCIPIANPDGAEAYTRVNANEVDLNRDSVALSQPESKLLRKVFDSFRPDYCFNLHDQRSIFAAGASSNPATVSFLAPSFDVDCSVDASRQKAINIIAAVNEELQKHIPNQVGRFDDTFNINCIGDMFQSLGVPTVLFEAGHFQEDYEREVTRKMIFIAYLKAIDAIDKNEILGNKTVDYFNIPQNKIAFFDFIYKNVKIILDGNEKNINFAAHYNEELDNERVVFKATIRQINDLEESYGHCTFNFNNQLFENQEGKIPVIDASADFKIGMHTEIVNGLIKK